MKDDTNMLITILYNNYSIYLSDSIVPEINDFIQYNWLSINIIKLLVIYILVKHLNIEDTNIRKTLKKLHQQFNISKKIVSIINHCITFKYELSSNSDEYMMSLPEYNNMQKIDSCSHRCKLEDIKADIP